MDRPLIGRRDFVRVVGAGAAATAVAFVGARRARAEARPAYGGKLTGSLTSEARLCEPLAAWSYAEQTVAALLFDPLYRVDARGAVVPQLAESLPEAGASATQVRIALRRGVRFHDGHELGAGDAALALERAAQAPIADWALADVERVSTDGAATLRLTLRRPVPPVELALALSAPQLAIARRARKLPLGTGPFMVDARGAQPELLRAHVDCFAGRPYVDELALVHGRQPDAEAREYEVGRREVSLRGAVAFAGHQPKYPTRVVDSAATWLVFLGFGKANRRVTDVPGFRAAVSQAIGRAAFRHVGSGERVVPALVPESPDLGGATPDAAAQTARPELARAALAPAAALRLTLVIDRTRLDDLDLATRLIAALDAAGVTVAVEALRTDEYQSRVAAGSCDLWLGQLLAPTPEPLHELLLAFAAGGDAWAASERRAGRLDRARALAGFVQRWPIVPLYHRAVRMHHRDTWHGLGFDALGRASYADAFQLATPAGGPR